MFFGTFAWSFVYVSLPFHIQTLTTADPRTTLTWTGWILGITPLVTVVTSPLWGRYAGSGNAKRYYVRTQVFQGLAFMGMALARTLTELFLSRLVLGAIGAASTFAFIMAGREGAAAEVRRRVAAIQSAMTIGQVVGPWAGAVAAAHLGFRGSFVFGGSILFGCGALVAWALPSNGAGQTPQTAPRPVRMREVAVTSLIILTGCTQIFFLASILPHVVPALGVALTETLEIGGFLIFASGVAAALGSVAAPRLSALFAERQLLPTLLIASSVLLALLATAGSVWSYAVLRFLQVLCIAPVFPIIVARVAHASGQAVGIINSARIGAAFTGPIIATTMLAWTSPLGLYLLLAFIGIACAPLTRLR
jgi:MFS family permease